MPARFTIEQNDFGGWELWDRKSKRSISSSAFREFVQKALSRLTYSQGEERAEWFRYYGAS